jgi:hypothetical protein
MQHKVAAREVSPLYADECLAKSSAQVRDTTCQGGRT